MPALVPLPLHLLMLAVGWEQVASRPARDACNNSATGTRTQVARVRAEYPNQLDYSGVRIKPPGKCHAAYQAIVDYQLHGVRYRAAALRRAPSPLHARRPNPEPHEHGTCGQHVPVSRRPASLHAPRHRRGALLPPRRRSTQYTPRPRRVDHVARPAPWMAGAGRSHGRARRTRAWPTPWCPTVAARGVSPALARRGAHVARPATATGACDGVVSIHIGVATTSAPRGSLPCAMQPHMRQRRTRGCAKGRGATASEPAAVPPPPFPHLPARPCRRAVVARGIRHAPPRQSCRMACTSDDRCGRAHGRACFTHAWHTPLCVDIAMC